MTVAVITHAPPHIDAVALEIPPRVKQHLGLDEDRSWIMLDEVNQFDWPGFDLRPVPGSSNRFAYGFVPPRLYAAAKAKLFEANARRKVEVIPR